MAPLVDCHTHTSFSDGLSTFEENVRAAVEAHCAVLVSTDHLTLPASMDPQGAVQVPLDKLPDHAAAYAHAVELAHELSDNSDQPLELVAGFECDWYPGCENNIELWSQGATVLLGSVHWIGDPGDVSCASGTPEARTSAPVGLPGSGAGWIDDPDDKHVWEELGPDEVWRRYVDAWCHACESSCNFSSLAHPDLPMRFAHEGYAATINLSPLWDEMALCAHDTKRRIEVSTAGLRKSLKSMYPSPELLARFWAAEVPLTVGSDAHRACDVGWGIKQAYRYALASGYRTIDIPHANGSWETIALP